MDTSVGFEQLFSPDAAKNEADAGHRLGTIKNSLLSVCGRILQRVEDIASRFNYALDQHRESVRARQMYRGRIAVTLVLICSLTLTSACSAKGIAMNRLEDLPNPFIPQSEEVYSCDNSLFTSGTINAKIEPGDTVSFQMGSAERLNVTVDVDKVSRVSVRASSADTNTEFEVRNTNPNVIGEGVCPVAFSVVNPLGNVSFAVFVWQLEGEIYVAMGF
jgi:hypothetical protein